MNTFLKNYLQGPFCIKESKMPKRYLEWIGYLSFKINIIELNHHSCQAYNLLHG